MISRRSLFVGAGALLAAPAIVRVASLMPVKAIEDDFITRLDVLYGYQYARPEWAMFSEITREAVRSFVNSNAFLKSINEEWEELFAKPPPHLIGSQLRIRLPKEYSRGA